MSSEDVLNKVNCERDLFVKPIGNSELILCVTHIFRQLNDLYLDPARNDFLRTYNCICFVVNTKYQSCIFYQSQTFVIF